MRRIDPARRTKVRIVIVSIPTYEGDLFSPGPPPDIRDSNVERISCLWNLKQKRDKILSVISLMSCFIAFEKIETGLVFQTLALPTTNEKAKLILRFSGITKWL